MMEAVSVIFDELIPEDYKFWSDDTLDLIGTDGDDNFSSFSVYLHDHPRVIFAGGGNDILYGDDNHDMLHGGTGNDTFFGDEGNDTLIDTEGYDTYHIKDRDTIYDKDGKGKILFDDKQLPKIFNTSQYLYAI